MTKARRLLLAMPLALALAVPAQASAADHPHGFAYAVVLNARGKWVGPTNPDGSRDMRIFDRIREAHPRYLRVVTHIGTRPNVHLAPVPRSTEVLAELNRLRAKGIHLGASINSYWVSGSEQTRHMSVDEVLARACTVRRETDAVGAGGPLYDWLFLDFALQRSTRGLQRLVNGLRAGQGCDGHGWRRVMANGTAYASRGAATIPRHVWAHAARVSVLGGGPNYPDFQWRKRVRRADKGRISALRSFERDFVRYVHRRRPASHPLLKLEIPHQTARFAKLPPQRQRGLLREWARPQRRLGFRLIHPLYVRVAPKFPPYDARREGTFRLQKRLLRSGGRLPHR